MARYGKKASEKVSETMHEMKEGKLRSGGSGTKVTSPKQAIAIGLSEARREGGKVPNKKAAKKPAKKTGAKAAKKPAKKTTRKVANKSANKAAKKPAKKAAKKKSAKKSTGRK
jgi:hypothetical protein